MNKIVREHYPVTQLPDDLRGELGDAAFARVTVEVERPARISLHELIERAAQLRREGKIKPISAEEAVRRIRAQRDGPEA